MYKNQKNKKQEPTKIKSENNKFNTSKNKQAIN